MTSENRVEIMNEIYVFEISVFRDFDVIMTDQRMEEGMDEPFHIDRSANYIKYVCRFSKVS